MSLSGLLAAQGLSDPAAGVVDAVRRAGAVQAQASGPARLAVRARTVGAGLTRGDVELAVERREVVVSWLMRGTLHLVAADDLRWMLALLGPHTIHRTRRRRDELGLTPELCERGLAATAEILAGGRRLTRAALVAELAARGVGLKTGTQQPAHFLLFAASTGLICRGPDDLSAGFEEPAYVLLDDWLPAASGLDRDAAVLELARRHRRAYGQATAADFAAWSGLPAGDCRTAYAELGVPEPADVADRSRVHLLAAFDPYLLGHKSRAAILDPAHAKAVNAGGGMIKPTVLLDGRIAGTWSSGRHRGADRYLVSLFGPEHGLAADAAADLAAEAADISRFQGWGPHTVEVG